jgi:hypothetical protein
MSCLPAHGRVACTQCFPSEVPVFDQTKRSCQSWRITWNPLAWGSTTPEIVVLGFSKGPSQAGALSRAPHDEIAYKGSRKNVGKILAHIGLLPSLPPQELARAVDRLIADQSGRFHFGSLIRCTVERFDEPSQTWKGSGGGMLDKFVATSFGREVVTRCARTFLAALPQRTKLVVMFGLGTKLGYVEEAFRVFREVRLGNWRRLNDVAYTDGRITVVHVEHFASQGSLIPDWIGATGKPRARFGLLARDAVQSALDLRTGS